MGPYHPALPQPIRLTFKLRGDRIVAVEQPVTGYCRRNVESLVIGQDADQALRIVERVCSLSGHSYRTALAQALEAATGVAPSPRAELVRAFFAEVERILARLWLLAQVARNSNDRVALRDALEARERLYTALVAATGERHYWGISEVGGVRALDDADLQTLASALGQLRSTFETWKLATSPRGTLGRLGIDVGRLAVEQAREQRVSSVAAHAAGVMADLRRDAPYGGYALAQIEWPETETAARRGDMAERCAVAVEDITLSVRLADALRDALLDATDKAGSRGASSTHSGSAKLEAPHGVVEAFVGTAADGSVAGFRLNTPDSDTAAILSSLLEGSPIETAGAIIASLDLCVECLDH